MRQRWLLFKQGFKGILKYKIQFFILILLSFLSIFYYVTTTSLTSRMNRAYDDVVGSFEKFDYSYIRKTDESNLLERDKSFLPILDFAPQNNNYIYDLNNNPIHESFNIVLNNHSNLLGEGNPLGETSFITKAFFDAEGKVQTEFKDIWTDPNSNYGNATIWSTTARYDLDRYSGLDALFGSVYGFKFNSTLDKIVADSKGADDNSKNAVTLFAFNTTTLLVKSLYDEIESKGNSYNTQKNDSLFLKYWFENELVLGEDFRRPEVSKIDNIDQVHTELSNLNELETYIFNALETIPFYLLNEVSSFNAMSQSKLFYSDEIEELKFWKHIGEDGFPNNDDAAREATNKLFETYNALAKEKNLLQLGKFNIFGLTEITNDESFKYNMELTFNYIFGSKLNESNEDSNNYVLNENDKKVFAINEDVRYLKNKDKFITFIAKEEPMPRKDSPEDYGKRGVVNPTYVYLDENGDFDTISSKNQLMPFEKLNKGQQYVSEFGGKDKNYVDRTYFNKSIYSMDIMHHEMAAGAADLELILREEVFYYDQVQKINFRFVVTDDKDEFNYKILAGVKSNSANEIVISQQFALINDYEIGSKIKIGNMNFVISGFGSDALTYYPLGDPEVPVSDVKNTVIAYAPKSVVQNIMSVGNEKDFLASTLMFMSDKNKKNEEEITESKIQYFDSLLLNNKNKLNSMFSDSQSGIENGGLYNGIKKFESTTFNLNWELQPQILKVVTVFSIISSVIIIVMAFVTLMFTIKKVVDSNSSQIGYLKAMGISSKKIGISYIGYALIIGAVIVPLAWICAGLFQEVISKVFSNYFSSTLYEFIFDWKILAIVWSIFLLGSLIFSYFITVWLTRKGALKIINKESSSNSKSLVNFKFKSLEKMPFRYRFALKVSGRGWKQIAVITMSTFVAIIIISVSALTPSVLSTYVNDATKYMKYKNVYDLSTPVSNLPTSKPSLTATHGVEYLEDQYKFDKELADDKIADILFDDVQLFNDLNWDSSLFPSIVLDNSAVHGREGDLSWQEEYMLRSKNNESESSEEFILNMVYPALGKILNLNGLAFSPGSFERFSHFFWSSDKDPITGTSRYDGMSSTSEFEVKQNQVKDNSTLFNDVIPQLLALLTENAEMFPEGPPEGLEDANSWKEKLLLLAMTFLPNTGMQFLKDSPNKLSQFTIGLNTENYTPTKETLSTNVSGKANNKNIDLTGLKSNQNVYMLDEISNRDDIFVNDYDTYEKLNNLFNDPMSYKGTPIKLNGSTLYDGNGTLNIPVITNLKTKEVFNFKNNNPTINSLNSKQLKLFSSDGTVIPKNAWVYDNRDAVEVGNKDSRLNITNSDQRWLNENYIPANDISPSKFTYNLQIDPKDKKFAESSSWFIDSYLDGGFSENDIHYELRPQYNYFNIKLFIPKSKLVGREEELLSGTSARTDAIYNIDNSNADVWNKNGIKWGGYINGKNVPELAKQAWQASNLDDEEWVWLSPYNVMYSNKSKIDNSTGATSPGGFEQISRSFGWAAENINASGTPIVIAQDSSIPDFIKEIKLVNRGTIDTYNTDIVIADQDILNLLTNRSSAKYIPVDYNFYGNQVRTIKSKQTGTTLPVYETLGPKDILQNMKESKDFYMKDMLSEYDNKLNEVVQNIDFTTKYSSFSEAYGVTSGFNGVIKNTPGIFMSHMQGNSSSATNNLTITYDKIDLVDSMLGLIITLAESILVVSLFLITGIIIITALVIAIMSDIFVSKYNRFIVTMRALGYTKWNIIFSVISISTISSWIFIGIGFSVGMICTSLLFESLKTFGVYIPFIFAWWVPVVIIIGVVVLSLLSCLISLSRSFKIRLTTLS